MSRRQSLRMRPPMRSENTKPAPSKSSQRLRDRLISLSVSVSPRCRSSTVMAPPASIRNAGSSVQGDPTCAGVDRARGFRDGGAEAWHAPGSSRSPPRACWLQPWAGPTLGEHLVRPGGDHDFPFPGARLQAQTAVRLQHRRQVAVERQRRESVRQDGAEHLLAHRTGDVQADQRVEPRGNTSSTTRR